MMKKSFILLLVLFTAAYAQNKNFRFHLQGEQKTFNKINDENPSSNAINDILIVGDTIWLATSNGLSKSMDNGLSWTNYYNTNDFGTESVSALAYDTITHSIWASLAHSKDVSGSALPEGSGLRFSTNNGATWYTVPQPIDSLKDSLETYGYQGKNMLHALPVTVRVQNITYDIAITRNVIWIASFAGGLRKNRIDSLIATHGQAPWKRVVLPPDSKYSLNPADTNLSYTFCLSPVSGTYCSQDNYNYRVFSVASAENGVLYVGTADGINKTSDALKSPLSNDSTAWVKFNHQKNPDYAITGNFVVGLQFNEYDKTLWAVTWKATDNTEMNGVSFTRDGGATWQTTLRDHKAYNCAVNKNIIVFPTEDGAFRTTNLGDSWLVAGKITDSKTKVTLQSSVFYAAAFSTNGNQLWLGSSEGLAVQSGYAQAWTNDWKLYIASQKLSSGSDSHAFPNPFSPKTDICKIKYSTGGSSEQVTIRIFSFSMKYIRTVIQNAQRGNPIGVINTTATDGVNGVVDFWDGKDDSGNVVPNGVYFYRIDIGSKDPVFGKIMVLE